MVPGLPGSIRKGKDCFGGGYTPPPPTARCTDQHHHRCLWQFDRWPDRAMTRWPMEANCLLFKETITGRTKICCI